MNKRIEELLIEAHKQTCGGIYNGHLSVWAEKFAELILQAVYDDVKEELVEEELINIEPDRMSREYLKGCNGGVIDALIHIKNFGKDIEE